MRRLRGESGLALTVALLATALLSALSLALVLGTTTESRIAANFRESRACFYAAAAFAELAIDDLTGAPDWAHVIDGSWRSTFVDGDPSGSRTLGDGTTVDLGQIVNMANCQKTAVCDDAEMNATTADRPWGVDNPRWVLVAYGSLQTLLPVGTSDSGCYVALLAGADPLHAPDVLVLRAEAFGRNGIHKILELMIGRGAPGAARLLAWHELP